MTFCPNCNKQLQDGAQFCDGCGAQLQQTIVFCPNCGKQFLAGATFCDACGTALSQVDYAQPEVDNYAQSYDYNYAAPQQQAAPKAALNGLLDKLSFIPKKFIGIGIAAIAVILVVVILFSTVFTPKASNHVLYLKDSQLFYTAVSKIKPFEVTENLSDDMSDRELVNSRWSLSQATHVTADGKLIFFMDEIEDGDYDFCYRYLNKDKKEAEKIDSNVRSYFVNKNGKKVVYLTSDQKLYQYDLKEKDKIDSDVAYFGASDDGKKIWYRTDDGDLYLKNGNKDKEKIEGGVDTLYFIDEDFKTFYYTKKGNLYKHKLGKDKEKIDSDISNVISIYESGEIYYAKDLENKEVSLMDYVDDDMASADAKMERPERPSFYDDFYDYYDDYDEARAAYNKAVEKYNDDYDLWREKNNRDELREELEEETIEVKTATLCYYNGKKSVEISDKYCSYNACAMEKPVIIFSTLDKNAAGKIKISEVDSYWDVREMVEEALDESGKKNLSVKDKQSELDLDEASNFDISADGKTVFFMKDVDYGDDDDDEDSNPHGDLYKMTISGNKAKKAEKYDTDVYIYSSEFSESGAYQYFKDYENEHGDLYIDKKKVDSDVYEVKQMNDTKKFVYITDYESKDRCGTLNLFDGKKSKKIADDVFDYTVTAKGEISYICDYDVDDYEGELFLYKGSKSKKIDDEAMALIATSDTNYHYITDN